jgi:hypothetical protein
MEVFDGCNLSLQQDSLSPGLSAEASGYWVAFNRVLGIGPVNFRLLLNAFLMQRLKIEPEREVECLEKADERLPYWLAGWISSTRRKLGSNRLIRDGARPVLEIHDILLMNLSSLLISRPPRLPQP